MFGWWRRRRAARRVRTAPPAVASRRHGGASAVAPAEPWRGTTARDAPFALSPGPAAIDMARLHLWCRTGRALHISYRDVNGAHSERTLRPFLIAGASGQLLIAWCELRHDFRTFRTDRIVAASFLEHIYPDDPRALEARWRAQRPSGWYDD